MKTINLIFVPAMVVQILSACSAPQKRFAESDHFDGTRFHNKVNPKTDSFTDAVKVSWELMTKKKNWPDHFTTPEYRVPSKSVENGIRVTYIAHSTVLIQTKDLNVITDPVFEDYIGVSKFLGVRSVTNPGLIVESLPHIDAVLISHNHYDHLDLKSIQTLLRQQKNNPPQIIVGLGVGKLLHENGIENVVELDWNESILVNHSRISFLESIHTSRRGLFDLNQTLWGSFFLESDGNKVYFAGDTAYGNHFKEVFAKFGPPDVSLIPIAAYEPRWFMRKEHMNPEESVRAHLDLKSRKSIAIHFGSFDSAAEGFDDPVKDLKNATRKLSVNEEAFLVPKHGEVFNLYK